VYDLGGGTFDISILEITRGVFRVVSTNGDTFLGGDDFDQRIIDLLVSDFPEGARHRPAKGNRLALQRLREAAEKAKHELSSSLETEINLPFIASTPSGPPTCCAPSSARARAARRRPRRATLEPCKKALNDARLGVSDIQQVVLVGGMTRMPLVQKPRGGVLQRTPHKGLSRPTRWSPSAPRCRRPHPGELESVLLLDVTPLSLGVETAGGVMTPLIPRNTTIPTRRGEVFSTSLDNQSFVPIHVLQGEREMAADNRSLYHFELAGIPPAPRGVPKVEVTFDIDANGILSVTATSTWHQEEGRAHRRRLGLSQRTSSASSPKLKRARALTKTSSRRNGAEALLYTSQNALTEYAQLLPDAEAHQRRRVVASRARHGRGPRDGQVAARRARSERVQDRRVALRQLSRAVSNGRAQRRKSEKQVGGC
jgi:molecular chaperone DnaK